MTLSAAETALIICQYQQHYDKIWKKYFPTCARRVHWKIIELVQQEEHGILFSKIQAKINDSFGNVSNTCRSRLSELLDAGLIEIDCSPKKIRSSTVINSSQTLKHEYNCHVVEAANKIIDAARLLNITNYIGFIDTHHDELNSILANFNSACWSVRNSKLSTFLREIYKDRVSLRQDIEQDLMRFAFDHILMKSWINSNQFNPERINFLRIDDFHREIFECTRVGYGATKGYVYDMVKWKILERKTAKNGVYDNVYSVKISNDFYELVQNFLLGFQEYFASSTVLFRECARKYALAQTVALTTEKNVSGTLVLSPR